MSQENGTSPWVYVGIGCGAVVVIIVIGIAAIGFFGARFAKNVQETMKDPVARTEKATEILNARQMPEGYFAGASIGIPILGDIVVLTDLEPDEKGRNEGFDERGFIYVNFRDLGNRSELEDFFEGREQNPDFLSNIRISDAKVRVRRGEVTKLGSLQTDDYDLSYAIFRRGFDFGGRSDDNLTNLMWIKCPQDSRMRIGIWFDRDPAPDTPFEELDVRGTTADETGVQAFLGHFEPCG